MMVRTSITTPRAVELAFKSNLTSFVLDFLLLVGSMLIAIQVRLQLPFGKTLLPGYVAQSAAHYALLFAAALAVHLASVLLRELDVVQLIIGPRHPFRRFIAALGLAALLFLALLPDLSQLQLIYFVVIGVPLGGMAIAFPQRIYAGKPENNVLDDFARVWRSHTLIQLWLNNNIRTRYSQTVLGVLWIILVPLSTAMVFSLAFTYFLRIRVDVPFICFFLSGLVPYNLFSHGLIKSTTAIISRMGLITHSVFPREILVILTIGEGLVDFLFTFMAMIAINAAYGIYPNALFIYLPFLLLLLLCVTLGFMFMFSALSVLIRDIPQFIAVLLQLFFYLSPVIYQKDRAPQALQYLFVVNPIASIIQGFRDIIIYGQAPDPVTLYYPLVISGIVLYFGYCVFKSIEDVMADML